ncbi:MAG: hypothetical protein ACK5X3_13755 [Pseudomonadota bacterium]|jgi:hypothetical protein
MSDKMDRMEILKLAMASCKDAKEGLALAREMVAFVQQEKAPMSPKEAAPILQAPFAKRGAEKANLHWTEEDIKKAATLLDNGASYDHVAKILGRTVESIRSARSKGKLPIQSHKLNEQYRTRAALNALRRGQQLSEASLDLLTRPSP